MDNDLKRYGDPMHRILVLGILTCILLAGCVEKKGNTSTVDMVEEPVVKLFEVTPDMQIPLPAYWKKISLSKVRASSFVQLFEDEKITVRSFYTGAPTADIRLPFLFVLTTPQKEMSDSEMMLDAEGALKADLLIKTLKLRHVIHKKEYDSKRRMIFYDVTFYTDKGNEGRMIMAGQYKRDGMALIMAFCASGDEKTVDAFKNAVHNIIIDENVRYN